jgi:hypothetical protein
MAKRVKPGFFAVDRIEGRYAILVGDDGRQFELPLASLPAGTTEGTILAVPVHTNSPAWSEAEIDAGERERRLEEAQARLKKLRQGDPGGDIIL